MSTKSQRVDALAQSITDLGDGEPVSEFLAALGIVVTAILLDLPENERMPACVGWIATLTSQIIQKHRERRTTQ